MDKKNLKKQNLIELTVQYFCLKDRILIGIESKHQRVTFSMYYYLVARIVALDIKFTVDLLPYPITTHPECINKEINKKTFILKNVDDVPKIESFIKRQANKCKIQMLNKH